WPRTRRLEHPGRPRALSPRVSIKVNSGASALVKHLRACGCYSATSVEPYPVMRPSPLVFSVGRPEGGPGSDPPPHLPDRLRRLELSDRGGAVRRRDRYLVADALGLRRLPVVEVLSAGRVVAKAGVSGRGDLDCIQRRVRVTVVRLHRYRRDDACGGG